LALCNLVEKHRGEAQKYLKKPMFESKYVYFGREKPPPQPTKISLSYNKEIGNLSNTTQLFHDIDPRVNKERTSKP
jgi:hypothetical protein